jgi:hypothetical protein
MDIRETGWEVVDWMHLVPDKDQSRASCEHCIEALGSIKCKEFIDYLG